MKYKINKRQIIVFIIIIIFTIFLYQFNQIDKVQLYHQNGKSFESGEVVDIIQDNITDNETTTKEDKEKVIKEQISKLNLKIIVNKDNPERKKSAYIISDNLKDIGIKNTIEELSIEDMNKALNEKNYDLALVGWELSLVPDATNILESIGYEDEKLTNYINSLKNATTESQISDIYKSIQKYVNENALYMSLVIRYDYIVTNRRIEGKISPNSFDIYEGITNLDIAK